MGYVDKNLMDGEEVVYTSKIHWFIYVPGFLLLALALAAATKQDLMMWAGALCLFAAFVLVRAFIMKFATELAVTTRRVISKRGLIMRETVEMNLSKVESFNVDQGILGRIFDFGTLIINGTGGGKTPIDMVDAPLEFRKKAIETIDRTQTK